MSRRFLLVCGLLLAGGISLVGYAMYERLQSKQEFQTQAELAKLDAEKIRANTVVPTEKRVPAGENFAAALVKLGLTADEAAGAAEHAFNLRQLRAGNTITVGRTMEGMLREIDYKIDPDRVLKIVPKDGGFAAGVKAIPSRTDIVVVSGRLEDSLFRAVEQAGESPELTMRLAQIFGYDPGFLHRSASRRHLSRSSGKEKILRWENRRLRKDSRRGIR